MAFGINIFDANGNSTIAGLAQEFVIETLIPGGSGSKSYPLAANESLRVTRFFTFSPGAGYITVSNAYVSGNTVVWETSQDVYSTFPMVDSILVTKVVT